MSDNQKHPYHLVDPSPWPLVTAASLLILAYGFISILAGPESLEFVTPLSTGNCEGKN